MMVPLLKQNSRTCAYQGVKSVSFLEYFLYVLNEWSSLDQYQFKDKDSNND